MRTDTRLLLLATLAIGSVLIMREAAPLAAVGLALGPSNQRTALPLQPPTLAPTTELHRAPPTTADASSAAHSAAPAATAAAHAPPPLAANVSAADSAEFKGPTLPQGRAAPFMALGIVSNVMYGNSFERRKWLRQTALTRSNVGKTLEAVFIVGMLQTDLSPVPTSVQTRLEMEAGRAQRHADAAQDAGA